MNVTGCYQRVLQIHPSLRCNLECLHCYSSSGPFEKKDLDPGLIRDAIADAASCGYGVVSFSGGEPLIYSPLCNLLEYAQSLGMRTAVTTNGILCDGRRLERLAPVLDFLAVSIDGDPASHNRLRNSPRAFDSMQGRLRHIRDSGIPFGFIFTLTRENVPELQWVASFAHREGALSLQVHPLEAAGRARGELRRSPPSDIDMTAAWLIARRLRGALPLAIHVDLVHCDALPSASEADRIVSPLVIEADGTVVPAQYGFPRKYALGSLKENRLAKLLECWDAPAFHEICVRTVEELSHSRELPFVNWYSELAARADPLAILR